MPETAAEINAERYRHKKRGTTYVVVGKAEVQAPEAWPLAEGEVAVVYRCEQTGKLWVRRTSEFHDGRFERLPPHAACAAEINAERIEAIIRVHWPQSPYVTRCAMARAIVEDGERP